jgi:hypothetical protein
MARPAGISRPAIDPGQTELLLRLALFSALAGAGISSAAAADTWRTVAPALASVAFAAVGIVYSLATLFDAHRPAAASGRSRVLLLGAAAIAMLVLAFALPKYTAAARPTPARRAVETVDAFLIAAVIDDDAYVACQYLTPGAQAAVARLARRPSCREALLATQPSFAGVGSVADLHRIGMRATVHGGRAVVTATPPGRPPARFGLVSATAAELNAFGAPQAPWRIATGATAVLHA